MLDQLLELFEREPSDRNRGSGKKRSLSDRLFGDSDSSRDNDRHESPDSESSSQTGKRKPSRRERLTDLFEAD